MLNKIASLLVIGSLSTAAFAGTSCDDLKAKIDAKVQSKGVKAYSLEVVSGTDVKDGKVVGSCDGGSKKIVYKRGA